MEGELLDSIPRPVGDKRRGWWILSKTSDHIVADHWGERVVRTMRLPVDTPIKFKNPIR